MKPDPIVSEVRKIRQAHAEKFKYQPDAIVGDLKKIEKTASPPPVSLPPKPYLRKTGS